ncbi:hemicentin-1-like isoform X3 [Anopheles albimanus]|nr:hemicentin-1-like isoform X3 [Anopheles albimanus]
MSWKTLPNYQPAKIDNTVSVGEQTKTRSLSSSTLIFKLDLVIQNITLAHQKSYRCEAIDDKNNTYYHNFKLQVRETPDDFVTLHEAQNRTIIHRRVNRKGETMPIEIMVRYKSYPTTIAYAWSREIIGKIEENRNVGLREELSENYIKLRINQPTVYNTDNYSLVVDAGKAKAIYNITIIVHQNPSLTMHNIAAVKGEAVDFLCGSVAYPSPEMWFFFQPCREIPWGNCSLLIDTEIEWQAGTQEQNSIIRSKISYKQIADEPGIIYCKANNSEGNSMAQAYLLLQNVSNLMSLEITEPNGLITVGDNVTFICSAIIIDGNQNVDITFKHNGKNHESITIFKDSNIRRKQLTLLNVGLDHTGNIDCYVRYHHFDTRNIQRSIEINVLEPIAPQLRSGEINHTIVVAILKPLQLVCDVTGVPEPKILWFKDGQPFADIMNNSANTTSITIPYATPMHSGLYECIGENKKGHTKISWIVTINTSRSPPTTFMNQPYLYAAVMFLTLSVVFAFISLFFYKRMKQLSGISNLLGGYVQMRPMLESSELLDNL